MKQKLNKGSSPTKPNVTSKNTADMISSLRDQSSLTDIPADCQEELDKKGLEGRWIDIVQLQKNQGWHKKDWNPHKFDCKLQASSNPFGGAAGSFDGYLVRQQMVLGAKPKAKAELQRAQIKLKTQLQSDPAALKAKEMREYVKASGVDSRVTDASDDED